MATNKTTLITNGDSPYFLYSGVMFQNQTQSNVVENYQCDNECIKRGIIDNYPPVELFSAILLLVMETYKQIPQAELLAMAERAEKIWSEKEERFRQLAEDERTSIITDFKFDILINLRALYKEQRGLGKGDKVSTKDLRRYVAMFRHIANTPLYSVLPIRGRRGDVTTEINEPLISFPPLAIEGEAITTNKKGDNPYYTKMQVSLRTIYRVGEYFIKFPQDLPRRLTKANTDNPIFNALIYELLRLRAFKDSAIKKYLSGISADNKTPKRKPKNNPCACDFSLVQILQFVKKEIRPNRLENYIINAFEAFKNIVGVIYDYKIIKDSKGQILRVDFLLNSQFHNKEFSKGRTSEPNTAQ